MQNLNFRYHSLDTARIHNRRFVGTVREGVYSGFKLRVNAGYLDRLDVTKAGAPWSILVTSEGVIVEETGDIANAVKIDPADSMRTRIDLVVCEYQFTTDTSIPAVFKVIKGKNQASVSVDPVQPVRENEYQVPLAYVVVRPQQASGGMAQVRISQSDVLHVPEADFALAEDLSALKPIIDPTNSRRIYVYPGVFPNSGQTAVLRWIGGYSSEIDSSQMTEGEYRYFLFGISDDKEVSAVQQGTDPDALTGYGVDVLPLAICKAEKSGGTARLIELTDVRFPFARSVTPQFEKDCYQDLLTTSVFLYALIDTLENGNFVDLDTVDGPTGYETLLKSTIDRSDTSLTFEWLGTTDPDADVTIVTQDLLSGSTISRLTHFMMSMDTPVQGITFDYSTVSKYSGFTNQGFLPDRIVTIPAGGGSRLYIRFRVPKDAFALNPIQKIYSYAAFLNLDPETLNQKVIGELGIGNLLSSVTNLIPNGDFRWWSRNDKNSEPPDCNMPSQIDYAVTADPAKIATGEEVFAADGWQFTKIQFAGSSKKISRMIYSEAALGSGIQNAMDTCLYWEGEGGTPGMVNYLELRVPAMAEMIGQKVTFSIDYRANTREAIGIGIAFYSRDEAGNFALLGSMSQAGAPTPDGTLLVESATAVAENVYAIGFVIIFQQTTGASNAFVRHARAAYGSYKNLQYTSLPNARDLLRPYYERGRMMSAYNAVEGEDIVACAQFGAVKHVGLSKDNVIVARVVSGTDANRSQNVDSFVLTATEQGIIATGRAISSGLAKIDLEWEALVLYPSVS